MYPHSDFSEHLAKQRREEFLRDAEALYFWNSEDHRSSLASNRALLGYLRVGQLFPVNTQPGQDIFLDHAHFDAVVRVRGLA